MLASKPESSTLSEAFWPLNLLIFHPIMIHTVEGIHHTAATVAVRGLVEHQGADAQVLLRGLNPLRLPLLPLGCWRHGLSNFLASHHASYEAEYVI